MMAVLCGAASVAGCAAGAAQPRYPDKPIRLIIPFGAGGITDVAGRLVGQYLGEALSQQIVIENRPGAGGAIAAQALSAAKPDGYTLLLQYSGYQVITPAVVKNLGWDPIKDFAPVANILSAPQVVVVNPSLPVKSLADLVAYAKANPGKVTYASPGAGSSLHLGMEQIASRAGVQFTHVPFKGGAETNAAVLGGHTMLQADSTGWRSLVDSGKLRLLVLWTEKRSKFWPDVPTLRDVGVDLVFDSPWGIAGPKGMDPAVVKRIDQAFKKALDDPKVKDVLDSFVFPVRYADQAGYLKIVEEVTKNEKEGLAKIGLAK